MKRDIKKYIDEYDKRFGTDETNNGKFYASDYFEIIKHAKSNVYRLGGGDFIVTNIVELVFTALQFGFMVGYKKAIRDYKQKANI